MEKYVDIIGNLVIFVVVAIIFLLFLAIILAIFLKKFKVDEKKIKLYGLFLNMDNHSLLAVSSLTINYLFLVWCMVSFDNINVIYVFFTYALVMIADIAMKNFPGIFINMILSGINCLAIWVVYIIYNFITSEYSSPVLIILLISILILIFMYYTFNFFRQLNDVVIKNKYLKKKNYKV